MAALVERLRGKDQEDQIRAAGELAKMGAKARQAARALCEVVANGPSSVRRPALEALETVDPTIYKQVVLLLVDRQQHNHIAASQALGEMGVNGAAAIPVLLAHVKENCSAQYTDERMLVADVQALAKVGPGEQEVVELFVGLTKFQKNRGNTLVRRVALLALVETGKAQPKRRKEIVPLLVAATETPPDLDYDEQLRLTAIHALGEFGPDAKAAAPALKALKLSPSMAIRDAAGAALEKIERDTKN